MPIDDQKFASAATRGDIAGVALQASIALGSIKGALERLKAGGDIEDQLRTIDASIEGLDASFSELTGFTPE